MPRDFRVYLEDILAAITKIRRYMTGFSKGAFAADDRTVDAAEDRRSPGHSHPSVLRDRHGHPVGRRPEQTAELGGGGLSPAEGVTPVPTRRQRVSPMPCWIRARRSGIVGALMVTTRVPAASVRAGNGAHGRIFRGRTSVGAPTFRPLSQRVTRPALIASGSIWR